MKHDIDNVLLTLAGLYLLPLKIFREEDISLITKKENNESHCPVLSKRKL